MSRRRLLVGLGLAVLALAAGGALLAGNAFVSKKSAPFAEQRARLLGLPPAPGAVTAPGPGTFRSSDPLLDRIWVGSVATAASMIAKGPLTVDAYGRRCAIDLPIVILDGWVRDRCPYVGDIYVVDNTLDVSHPSLDVQRSMLAWFAQAQHISGAIPASPIFNGSLVLFDYNAYWIQALYEYALHSGNVAFVREVWPNLDRLMGWYAARTRADGLLVNNLGPRDYGYVHRRGNVVAYYNAQYALTLREAIRLAVWAGETQDVVGWLNRANSVARAFTPSFWDATAGAFADTTTDFGTHPQDANAFAILAGLATPQKAASALSYLALHNSRFYGNTYTDSSTWTPTIQGASQWVYPFMSYEEVLARFETGSDSTALDLIRREWGYMLTHGPKSTMWETIGALGTGPINPAVPSWDHGWSSGAAPALTEYVLGVEPTSPGFTTFTVDPHPGDLKWASGTVPTPHGPILVSWRRKRETIALHVTAPPGTVWLRGVPSTP